MLYIEGHFQLSFLTKVIATTTTTTATMHHHHHHTCLRHYATKYTARVTSTSPTGRSLTAEVTPPQPPLSDVRGYLIPRRHVICETARLVQSKASASSVSSYLTSLSPPLSSSEASEALKSLTCPRLALAFFRFLPHHSPAFRHDAFTYNRLLLILSRSSLPERLDLARALLQEMDGSATPGNISTVNLCIGLFGSSEDLKTCLGLVAKWGLKMNSYTYKCLLQAYLRSRDVHEAWRVYGEMRRRGYKLDIFAYNMLLDALAKLDKVRIRALLFVSSRRLGSLFLMLLDCDFLLHGMCV